MLARWVASYPYSLKAHLTYDSDLEKDLQVSYSSLVDISCPVLVTCQACAGSAYSYDQCPHFVNLSESVCQYRISPDLSLMLRKGLVVLACLCHRCLLTGIWETERYINSSCKVCHGHSSMPGTTQVQFCTLPRLKTSLNRHARIDWHMHMLAVFKDWVETRR